MNLSKLLSGRFLMVVFLTGTFCAVQIGLVVALLQKTITPDAFFASFGTLATLVGTIATSYFGRSDRHDTPSN